MEKKFALFQIQLNAGIAISKVWSQAGIAVPLAIALTAIHGAISSAQTAMVLSQPIPAFAMGTGSAPGGSALVGEAGPEIVDLPQGASVTPNHQLQAMANSTVNNTENVDNSNISMVIQPTNYEDFIRQAKQRLGKDAFS